MTTLSSPGRSTLASCSAASSSWCCAGMAARARITAMLPSWGLPPPGSPASTEGAAPRLRPAAKRPTNRAAPLISPTAGPLQLHLDHREHIAGAVAAAQRGKALWVERFGGVVDRVAQRRRQLVEHRQQFAQQGVAI